VNYTEKAGRYMVSTVAMPSDYDFLIEAPIAAWPLVASIPASVLDSDPDLHMTSPWCEGCLGPRKDKLSMPSSQAGSSPSVRRRLTRKQAPRASPYSMGDECTFDVRVSSLREARANMFCESCWSKEKDRPPLLTPDCLRHWRRWQSVRSPESQVGLEAFGRCLSQVAFSAAEIRKTYGLSANEAAHVALRPFYRLAQPPEDGSVELHGTSASEVAAELRCSQGFMDTIGCTIGCHATAVELVSEDVVELLAGRLVLNAAGMEIPGVGYAGAPLRAAGVFVLLSTMNHSCDSSARATFSDSSCVTLWTRKSVVPGEPLTLAYVSSDLPVKDRRERLSHWFFHCDCFRCESESCITDALS